MPPLFVRRFVWGFLNIFHEPWRLFTVPCICSAATPCVKSQASKAKNLRVHRSADEGPHKRNRSFGYQAERGRRGGCIVWANYSEALPPPPRLRLFPRMSRTDLVSLTFKDESRTGHTQEHTHMQTHMDQWRPGTCVTTVSTPGWSYTSLIMESWLVHHGEKSLYYDKMGKGPLRAETLLTGPGFGHRICILCTFLFSHQTKIIT